MRVYFLKKLPRKSSPSAILKEKKKEGVLSMRLKNGVLETAEGSYDYIQFGKGTRHLVLIPGVGDGLTTVKNKALMGAFLYKDFTKDFRVTMISRNNVPKKGATVKDFAREQAEVLHLLDIHKASVIGVSLGGMIAQELAVLEPDLIDRLVLVVTLPKANELMIENAKTWISMAEGDDYAGILKDFDKKCHPNGVPAQKQLLYPFLPKPKSFERFLIQANACITHDASAHISEITAPTLVIGGGKDNVLGKEGSILLAEMIPNASLYIYPDLSHSLYEDAADNFNYRVLEFLTN